MATTSRFANGNRLLQALSAGDLAALQPHLALVDLPLRRDIEKPNRRIEDVVFMEAGIASVVAIQPHSTYIQLAGKGQRIAASELRKAMDARPSLNAALLKFVQAFMVQTAHTAIANARAKLHERLARWLLMAHDRVPGNTVALTHEFLSLMLAVRRAGVTEAVHVLKQQNLIAYRRAEITIVNRKGLEKIAANFYGVPEAEYRRLIN
jgi:hypothetical protein